MEGKKGLVRGKQCNVGVVSISRFSTANEELMELFRKCKGKSIP